ncbi:MULTISPECIES: helix-turn-helix domain-containing protein [Bifidobacterium]|uniref:DNA-binding helix-turn-helix protein n=1 Tax=Bifidobacterium biavatii DSM 23969 TaxID=1437608 RepID=A0A086ZW51_9BIFI|nr:MULTISPECIES: helix-turn-helix domain-containing protein [Bifidobacterium]KFI50751.1 DNA-binding helix-turn-helix protein [Bifidobacterium biavatii DSM 23969]
MSIQALSRVFTLKRLIEDPYAQLVLINLADNADEHGRNSFPGIKKMARNSCMCERSVQRKLRWLEENGFIRKSEATEVIQYLPEYKRPTVWEICMDRDETLPASSDRKPRGSRKGEDPTRDGATGDDTAQEFNTGGSDDEPGVSQTPGASQSPGAGEAPGGSKTPDALRVTSPVTVQSSKPSYEPITPLSPKGDISPRGDSTEKVTPTTSQSSDASNRDFGDDNVSAFDCDALLHGFAELLASEQVMAKPVRARDQRAAAKLLTEHSQMEILELVLWTVKNPFWRAKTLSMTEFARHWERLRQERRGEIEQRQIRAKRIKAGTMPAKDEEEKDPHAAVLVSCETATRCPVFGYSSFQHGRSNSRIAFAQNHLNGSIRRDKCPVCAYDERNLALHGNARTTEAVKRARIEADEQTKRWKEHLRRKEEQPAEFDRMLSMERNA